MVSEIRGPVMDTQDKQGLSNPVVVVAPAGLLVHARKLGAGPKFRLIESVGGNDEVLEDAEKFAPCISMFDASVELKRQTIIEMLDKGIRTVVVVSAAEEPMIASFLRLGHSGVISTFDSLRKVRKVLRVIAAGEVWATRRMLSELVREGVFHCNTQNLTPRETEILALIAEGHKNKEIAERLFVTRETVRWHQRRLYSKLGRDRAQIAQLR
jgi:DNA-binding NarL/FixJ family response regulator